MSAPGAGARIALELAGAGDLGAIMRRLEARIVGRAPPLPETLAPAPRARGPRRGIAPGADQFALMLSPALNLTGAPISGAELAIALAAAGWRIETWAAADGPARRIYEAAGLPLRIEPRLTVAQSTPARYEAGVAALAEAIAGAGAGLVYANTVDLFPAIDAARLAGLPSVWNIRESEPWRQRLADRHPKVAARALAAFAYPARVIFVAEAAARTWQDFLAPGARQVIYNAPRLQTATPTIGRDAARAALGVPDKAFLFVAIGTICARKGQIDIAAALARLAPTVLAQIRVTLIGDAEPAYLKKFRAALSREAAARVHLAGVLEDAGALLAGADALLNTSRAEAFPRTFLEAAAAGAPIIAADVDGAGERLTHGKSALLYRPGDAASLADCMARLALDRAAGAALARAARLALVENWTYEDMGKAYAEAFAAAVRSDRSPA